MTISPANFTPSERSGSRSVTASPQKSASQQPGKPASSTSTTSMHPSLPMSARTGRSTARYTPGTNRRLCAGVVPLSTQSTIDSPGHHTHVLLTSSSRHPDRYVLPKGGWEQDETAEQSALREGWEEAGVVGKITQFLGQHVDPRPPNKVNVHDKKKKHKLNGITSGELKEGEYVPRAEYLFYEVAVDKLEEEYPESNERNRKWVTYEEAMEILSWRPEMAKVIELSQLVRPSRD